MFAGRNFEKGFIQKKRARRASGPAHQTLPFLLPLSPARQAQLAHLVRTGTRALFFFLSVSDAPGPRVSTDSHAGVTPPSSSSRQSRLHRERQEIAGVKRLKGPSIPFPASAYLNPGLPSPFCTHPHLTGAPRPPRTTPAIRRSYIDDEVVRRVHRTPRPLPSCSFALL